MKFDSVIQKAYEQAQMSLNNSYAPYSEFHVASVIKLKNQEALICGVNVENASYGGTICAERSAIVSAISQYGKTSRLEWIVITSSNPSDPIPPCGMCLQVIVEFADSDLPIYLGNKNELKKKVLLKELMPMSFKPEMIQAD